MMRGMYSAISGLKAHQVMLDVTANDLANVNTVGYKASRTTFKDSLAQLQRSGASMTATTAGNNAAQIGLGVQLGSIDNVMSSGAFQPTGSVLDVAIQGEGWYRVGSGTPTANPSTATPNPGQLNYTRGGNFTRNDAGYITTQDGLYVVGRNAPGAGGTDCYLAVPPDATDVAISPDGQVSFIPANPAAYTPPAGSGLPPLANGRAVAGWISLTKFANESGLERVSGNRWRASAASGSEVAATPAQVATPGITPTGNFGLLASGTLEMSNVDLATEFTNMITAQRGFQANSRVIAGCDEMLQDLVNLKR
jgi:flagellar hook protein FlgE